MAQFDEIDIKRLFSRNLQTAKDALQRLEVFCGEEPKFNGLPGWVFEKAIQNCIRKELKGKGVESKIREQVSLGGRSKVDLVIGEKIAIEIKVNGLYEPTDKIEKRYQNHRKAAENRGWQYIFLSLDGTYGPYREAIIKALGEENVFYLFFGYPLKQQKGEWKRLINLLCSV